MDELLRTHLLLVEDRLQQLQQKLTSPNTPPANIPLIMEEIQFRQDALNKLRRALELEPRFHEHKPPAKPSQRANNTKAPKL